MSSNLVESLIGAIVLLVAGWFLTFAYQRTDVLSVEGYTLQARFTKIDGLNIGNDVRVAGIKVGTIVDSVLDVETYQAVVTFSVRAGVKLPADTAAIITSESLLGGSYLSLSPGADEEFLENGDEIEETQGAVDLISLIGKFAGGDSD
ncbi:MAG: outer membrane lipid asymmetry maintenance protein MlaD [Kordiimonadales bacterium]|nr:MAG: outer membrane lipid asymmetry maintenance protein MlaD [Kordiimonadales bacterium]